jgi:hypothetical protein
MVLSAYKKSTLFPMTGGPFWDILKGALRLGHRDRRTIGGRDTT